MGENSTYPEIRLIELGQIDPKNDAAIVALYLMKEEKYGALINLDGLIEYFEYDADEPDWRKRIGSADRRIDEELFYARTLQYYRNPDKIQSHFFNRTDGSLLLVGSEAGLKKLVFEKTYTADGSIDQMGLAWKSNAAVLSDLKFSEMDFVPTQIAGNEDGWMVFSDH